MEKVIFEGKEYTLTQDAYIAEGANRYRYGLPLDDDRPFYKASAVDQEGNEFEVAWEVVDHWQELEDENEMCDWENPASVERI